LRYNNEKSSCEETGQQKEKSMVRTALVVLALLALPAFCGEPEGKGRAGEKTEEGAHRPKPGMIAKFILAHAQDLNITDEQKQKIETWVKEHQEDNKGKPPEKAESKPEKHGKGPFSEILTDEQQNKLKELLKTLRAPGNKPFPEEKK